MDVDPSVGAGAGGHVHPGPGGPGLGLRTLSGRRTVRCRVLRRIWAGDKVRKK